MTLTQDQTATIVAKFRVFKLDDCGLPTETLFTSDNFSLVVEYLQSDEVKLIEYCVHFVCESADRKLLVSFHDLFTVFNTVWEG